MSNRSFLMIENDLASNHGKRFYIEIMLFCLVLGEDVQRRFEASTNTQMTVSGLQKVIKDLKQNCLNDVDPDGLNLWKVMIPTRDENDNKWKILNNKPHDQINIKEDLEGKLLQSDDVIEELFDGQPLPKHIHILVQPSQPATTGKRKMEYLDEDIVKKGRLTNFQDKNSKMIKHLIDNLGSIDTNQQTFDVPPLPGEVDKTALYNRKCYNYYRNFILSSESHNRFLITGNPGVGKTYFGRLMLVELLKRGRIVIFDCKDCTILIDPQEGVTFPVNNDDEYKLLAQGKDTWCIIDGRKPQMSHDWNAGRFIMVSSPRRDIIVDFDKPRCKTLYMPTWNEDELLKCWENLYKSEITKEEIKTKFDLCGGIPRWIFDSEMSHAKIRNMIISASQSIDSCILDSYAKLFFGYEFSHKIIQIHTNLEDTENPYTDSICLFASKFAGNTCLDHLKKHNKEKLRTFIENARNIKEMSALRGQLFELISHEILRHGGSFLVRKLTDDGPEPEIFKEFESNLEENFFWFINEVKDDILQQGPTKYYRPVSDTFESIDSYIYPNEMFQVTISKRHSIKQEGLRAIKETLDETSEINIYFVLPKDIFENFKTKQPYENKGSGKVFDAWINNIVQYALCIDLDKYCI